MNVSVLRNMRIVLSLTANLCWRNELASLQTLKVMACDDDDATVRAFFLFFVDANISRRIL